MKDLGNLKFFLGIDFARSKEGIVMSQRKYALELISESGLWGANPAGTPLELNQKLTSEEYDKAIAGVGSSEATDATLKDPCIYQRLYLTMTRPDLAFVVQGLSQYMHNPKVSHMESTLRVVRYIKGALGLGLVMPTQNAYQLSVYCDSDWGSCLQTRSSVTGYVVKFGDALISWKSKK
uniref:Uncharacterized mitochondrial protein AtMg00810-like n=1 Tax=Nicotiana tabacum TaxID=4097 RepID=A0A1S4BWP3_TOBAC|nr:PREDICTED: uncharacterized mitochondrial protein AtMg00810-like [Nicotiana tabacum]